MSFISVNNIARVISRDNYRSNLSLRPLLNSQCPGNSLHLQRSILPLELRSSSSMAGAYHNNSSSTRNFKYRGTCPIKDLTTPITDGCILSGPSKGPERKSRLSGAVSGAVYLFGTDVSWHRTSLRHSLQSDGSFLTRNGLASTSEASGETWVSFVALSTTHNSMA